MAAYAALVSLMRIINNLQSHPRPPLSLDARQAESLIQRVGFLLEFLEGYNPQLPYSREADPLESRIANAAYSAEYAIESHIFDQFTNDEKNMSSGGLYGALENMILDMSHIFDLMKNVGKNMSSGGLYEALEMVIQDMASIEEEAKEIQGRVGVQQPKNSKPPDSSTSSSTPQPPESSTSSSIPQPRDSSTSSSKPPDSSTSSSIPQPPDSSTSSWSSMVGQIMDKLTSNSGYRQIIPIVGMGGSGKTTLARTIFEGRLVQEHFDFCGWATISQNYSIREIFAVVLHQLNIGVDDDLGEDELGDKLYRHLYDRRYLIVMDDMWSIEPWDGVNIYFPDNENGSRIMVTTRLANLASTLAHFNSIELPDSPASSWIPQPLDSSTSSWIPQPPDSSTSSWIPQPPDSSTSSWIPQLGNIVGVDNVKLQIMDKLTPHYGNNLQIIPIIGMGGSGKTTLARTIFEGCLNEKHFDICAWATISQEYSIREIFAVVLRQFNVRVDDDLHEPELRVILHKQLFSRRYLIVMDDIWSIEAWDRVGRYFPNNKNGSRIVVTTRLADLASTLANSNTIKMKLLDEDDSWDLLSKTVFGKGSCPLDLEEIGKKIGKNCKGLPLSIVVVGGLLAKSEQTIKFWEYIEGNLNAIVNLEDDERCLKILYMSYQQLPLHLKPCFLYMGVFPEDELISTLKLINVWSAEGFIKPVGGKSLEEIAQQNLKDLIGRNLIMSHKMGITGKMKYCKIHDLLRDLCLREAQKQRFYNIASDNKPISALPSTSQARCLTWGVRRELSVLGMSLLRIVETRRFHLAEDFFENVDQLVNSRYLEIFTRVEWDFPFSIWRFWNLQTLIVYNGNEVTAPTDFWYMTDIKHVEFYRLRLSDPPIDQDDIVLGNLQRLGTVYDFKCSEQVVRKIPNIKKLVFDNGGNLDDDMYYLSNFDGLTKLESMDCTIFRTINFPQSLKRLVVRSRTSRYFLQGILDKIGELPHLEKLKLDWGRFNEGVWEATDSQFCSLKSLHLYGCEDLKEIPSDFVYIPLREIVVQHCSDSVVESAKKISEEIEDLCDEVVQVRVVLGKDNKEGLESLASPNFHVERVEY